MKRYLLLERRMTLHHHSPYWECVMAVLDAGQKRQNARHHNPSLAIQQTLRSSVARFFVLYSHPLKLHISRPSLLTKLWIKYLSDAFFYDCQTEMPIKLLTRFIASELNKIAKWIGPTAKISPTQVCSTSLHIPLRRLLLKCYGDWNKYKLLIVETRTPQHLIKFIIVSRRVPKVSK